MNLNDKSVKIAGKTYSRPITPPRAVYYALWLCTWSTALAFDRTFTHIAECAGLQIDLCIDLIKVQKLCNCSPTRGLHDMMDFKSLGDMSTLRVLSQVKHAKSVLHI